jgi:hypothetical protein
LSEAASALRWPAAVDRALGKASAGSLLMPYTAHRGGEGGGEAVNVERWGRRRPGCTCPGCTCPGCACPGCPSCPCPWPQHGCCTRRRGAAAHFGGPRRVWQCG